MLICLARFEWEEIEGLRGIVAFQLQWLVELMLKFLKTFVSVQRSFCFTFKCLFASVFSSVLLQLQVTFCIHQFSFRFSFNRIFPSILHFFYVSAMLQIFFIVINQYSLQLFQKAFIPFISSISAEKKSLKFKLKIALLYK